MNAEELPDFWSAIANDQGYSEDRRRHAVFMLFQRHVKVGISLHELGKILNHPVWLKPDNILVVQSLGGQVPVEFNLQDTIFRLSVFPNLTDDRLGYWAIYCRIEGKISAEEAYEILNGGGYRNQWGRRLLEFALIPDDLSENERKDH